jgi:peroxiredoxin
MTSKCFFRLWAALMVMVMNFPAASFALGRISPEATRKAIEEKAPDFVLKDLQGRTFKLSEQRGKPVLLIFSTTWCPSCREEIPHLKDIHAAYAAKGLEMVNIDIQEKKEKVSPFAARNKIPYRTLLDTAGDVAGAYEVRGIPNLVLIDRKGIIVCKQCGSLDTLLKKMFTKP